MCLKLLKMPCGRPQKRRYFLRQREHSRALESTSLLLDDEGHVMNDQENADNQVKPDSASNTVRGEQSTACAVIPLTEEVESTLTLNTEQLMTGSAIGTQENTTLHQDRRNDVSNTLRGEQSKPCAMMPLTQENEGILPLNTEQIIGDNKIGIQQSTLNQNRPVRSSKVQCFQIIASYNTVERQKRLEYLRKRASARLASESADERRQQLENLRKRASVRPASESTQERLQRLEYQRKRASIRRAFQSTQEKTERLEKQRQARYEMALQNQCPTYKMAVTTDISHFPGQHVFNGLHRDFDVPLDFTDIQQSKCSEVFSSTVPVIVNVFSIKEEKIDKQDLGIITKTDDASASQQNSHATDSNFEENKDYQYLMGILPQLRELPKKLKQKFKNDVQNLLNVAVFAVKKLKRKTTADDSCVSQQNSCATDSNFEEDKDYQYLMGILPQLKELPEKLKEKFKNDVQNLLTVIHGEKLRTKATDTG